MKILHRFLVAPILLTLGATSPLWSQCDRQGRSTQPIPFGAEAVPMVTVPRHLAGAAVITPPIHGQLVRDSQGGLFYTPLARFWTVGTDRFTVAGPGPSAEAHTVQLLAPTWRFEESLEEAENPPTDESLWQLESSAGGAGYEPWAALSGERGLWLSAHPLGSSYLKAPFPHPTRGYGDAGTGAQGGWKPPGSGGGQGGTCIPPGCPWPEAEALILTLGAPAESYVGLRARTTAQAVELRLEASEGLAGRWMSVSQTPHQLTLLAWDRVDAPSLAAFFLDGELAATVPLSFRMASLATQEARFGSQGADPEMPGHGWDHLSIFSLAGDAPRADCLRQDRFEAEALSDQWHVFGANNLAVEPPALSANRALVVDPAGPGSPKGGLVIASSLLPHAIGRLGARFLVDTGALTLPSGSSLLLVDAANSLASRSFRLLLDGTPSGQSLRVIATHLDNQSVPAQTAVLPWPSGSSRIVELDWQRSPTDQVGTGYLRLFVDGEEVAELTGLANAGQALMDVRVGGTTLAGSPSGELRFDELEMWFEP